MENKFTEFTDEQLVDQAQNGDMLAEEYLIRKYKELVRKKSKLYFIIGADGDDVVQEEELESVGWYDLEETYFRCSVRDPAYCVPMGGLDVLVGYLYPEGVPWGKD